MQLIPVKATDRRCSIKKVIFKISQNSLENIGTDVFLRILRNFQEHLFYRTPLDNSFCPGWKLHYNIRKCMDMALESLFFIKDLWLRWYWLQNLVKKWYNCLKRISTISQNSCSRGTLQNLLVYFNFTTGPPRK